MSVTYRCPECQSILRPKAPIPAGKKIKCPRCEAIFAPQPVTTSPQPAAVNANTPQAGSAEEPLKPDLAAAPQEDENTGYKLAEEPPETEEQKKAREVKYGSLRKKFDKNQRGPAIAKCVQPANWMLRMGLLLGVLSVLGFMWAIWPMIFNDEPLSPERMNEQTLYAGIAVGCLVWGMLVSLGSSKMHDLESYPWALVGSLLAVPLVGTGLWGLVTLRDKVVMAGFDETLVMHGLEPRFNIDPEDFTEDDDDDDDDLDV